METTRKDILDLRGLKCPIPLMRTKKILKTIDSGEKITLLITDPATKGDLVRFCRGGRCDILEHSTTDGVERYVLAKI